MHDVGILTLFFLLYIAESVAGGSRLFPHSPSPINALDLDWHAPSSPRKKQKPCPSGFTVIESFKKIALRGLCGSHKNLSWRSRLQFSFSTPDIFLPKRSRS